MLEKIKESLRGRRDKIDQGQALKKWQERLKKARAEYQEQLELFDQREQLYQGARSLDRNVNLDKNPTKLANNVRNIAFELIETQVDSNIPLPKVNTAFQNAEEKAQLIEESLKSDMERLPFTTMNDMQERTCPIQGGSWFFIEWDNTIHTHETIGDLKISLLHPKQVIPQAGMTSLEESDYVFIQLAQSKEYIKLRYGVDVANEEEEEPGLNGIRSSADNLVTQNIAYYRNGRGGIGIFSWVNDEILEDLEDYQARRAQFCKACGTRKDDGAETCPDCGGKVFVWKEIEYEELAQDIQLSDGTWIPAMSPLQLDGEELTELAGDGVGGIQETKMIAPTRIPYYKPNCFPLVLRKNVSAIGKMLGDSDIDKIRDQQDAIKKLGTKAEEKMLKGGSFVVINKRYKSQAVLDDGELKVLWVDDGDMSPVRDINIQPDISADMNFLEMNYEWARSTLGVTDSFQGKRDPTATSGKAKEFAASQTAGRFESKIRMKYHAYSELFQLMFRFKLAFCDEPRPFVTKDNAGNKIYKQFNKYDFLDVDDAGEWFYNDQFLFGVDSAGGLASDKQYMWEQARQNLSSGLYGDPSQTATLLRFWGVMEQLHYPMAGNIKAQLVEEQDKQEQQAALAMSAQENLQQGLIQNPDFNTKGGELHE